VTLNDTNPPTDSPSGHRKSLGFSDDFRRFFLRGLAALLPTLVTLWLLIWVYNFLWDSLGYHIILAIIEAFDKSGTGHPATLHFMWEGLQRTGQGPQMDNSFSYHLTKFVGVVLSLILVYIVGVFVGNFIGRSMWRMVEVGVLRIPLIRAVYPAVKQITDFLLAERSTQFQASRVVAVQPHEKGIWSIGLVTGAGVRSLSDATGQDMVTVFVPSSPTAFSGYVLVVPRSEVIELPLKVEEAMKLLVSGGVLSAGDEKTLVIPSSVTDAGGAKIPVPSSPS
jgi:uncharacterized membrane protein